QSLGDEFGSLTVALIPAEERNISNAALMNEWRSRTTEPAGLEKLIITQPRNGPPGKAIELKLTGDNIAQLKQLSLQIQDRLKSYAGVSNVDDDLPFGSQQLIFSLTPAGEALGLNISQIGRQIRSALEGIVVQSFYKGDDNIDVRIQLPESQRNYLQDLQQLPLILANGSSVPLSTVVHFEYRRGLDLLRRVDGELSVIVMADVDDVISNSNLIISQLEQEILPQLRQQYPVRISYEGRAASQQETMADMKTGLILGLSLIYIILAWVFASYRWPLAIMIAIPFGLTGAIFGHFIQGMDLTVLSLFGFFGLSGIVINDSIVLITFYQKLRAEGMRVLEAIEEAACQRLRAVLLTSLTTIAGLTPILFETSLQAKFLIPMATSLVFGLAFGTVLILLVVPSVLVLIEFRSVRREQRAEQDSDQGLAPEA
ncbi:MAG: efflux RND transporter permease subunit, partial [Oceanospirillum sp.]|nr:efflux RND transporter permease subunit [Oceanospirillum sp.]